MNSDINALMAERAAIDQKIAELRQSQTKGAIDQIHQIMAEFGLTLSDLGGKASKAGKAPKSAGSVNKVAPKYKNPVTGDTWTGRGKAPLWIADKAREQFLI